jgi:hypothetical protein
LRRIRSEAAALSDFKLEACDRRAEAIFEDRLLEARANARTEDDPRFDPADYLFASTFSITEEYLSARVSCAEEASAYEAEVLDDLKTDSEIMILFDARQAGS